jgi:hypothetical protein
MSSRDSERYLYLLLLLLHGYISLTLDNNSILANRLPLDISFKYSKLLLVIKLNCVVWILLPMPDLAHCVNNLSYLDAISFFNALSASDCGSNRVFYK